MTVTVICGEFLCLRLCLCGVVLLSSIDLNFAWEFFSMQTFSWIYSRLGVYYTILHFNGIFVLLFVFCTFEEIVAYFDFFCCVLHRGCVCVRVNFCTARALTSPFTLSKLSIEFKVHTLSISECMHTYIEYICAVQIRLNCPRTPITFSIYIQ